MVVSRALSSNGGVVLVFFLELVMLLLDIAEGWGSLEARRLQAQKTSGNLRMRWLCHIYIYVITHGVSPHGNIHICIPSFLNTQE